MPIGSGAVLQDVVRDEKVAAGRKVLLDLMHRGSHQILLRQIGALIHHQCGHRIASLTRSRGPHAERAPAPISAPCPCKNEFATTLRIWSRVS